MYLILTVALLCQSTVPPTTLPGEGQGLWLNSDCEWVPVQCPTMDQFKDDNITIRLPIFCPVYLPRIGYSVKTDTDVRRDLSKASSLIPSLNVALASCRDDHDIGTAECIKLVEQSKAWLHGCVKESTLQLQEVEKLERRKGIYKIWAITSTSIAAVLSAIIILQNKL